MIVWNKIKIPQLPLVLQNNNTPHSILGVITEFFAEVFKKNRSDTNYDSDFSSFKNNFENNTKN